METTNVETSKYKVAIIGAGPAGLTSAYELSKRSVPNQVFEADSIVGGISRTPEIDGWRFDIGGHRFFTKVKRVEDFWHEILNEDEFLKRPRMSRIFYKGKFYDYPIKPMNALRNLGVFEALACICSYLWVRIRPPKNQSTLEGYIARDYGWRLYKHFFKTYNEKVWGVPASALSADWGAQRIKGMSLFQAVWEPLRSRLIGKRGNKSEQITSLIEEFYYPKFGPGMMWERCTELCRNMGTEIEMNTKVVSIERDQNKIIAISTENNGKVSRHLVSHLISSMPLSELIMSISPSAPESVIGAAKGLHYRDFLTVALVVPLEFSFPDNWIYVHSPEVKVGRIQNFGSWSPYMVKDSMTCLGLEYFVFEGDELWNASDSDLVELAKSELALIGLADKSRIGSGYVVRMPKAYPVYDEGYADKVEMLRCWIDDNISNLYPVGRNGMHRYNNQDHSMYTAILSVENILGAHHDIWSVNVEAQYHEEDSKNSSADKPDFAGSPNSGGRIAPVVPSSTNSGGRVAPVVPRRTAT